MSHSWLTQLYTWAVFGAVYLFAWDAALVTGVARLNSDSSVALIAGSPRTLRRPYLIALCLYTLVVAWFSIAFLMLVCFCGCTLIKMTAPLCHRIWEDYVVNKFFVPAVVFNSVDLMHAPFHGVAALGTLSMASVAVGFYVCDDDLLREQHVHSKAVRALFIPPAVAGVAYALYALYCILETLGGGGGKKGDTKGDTKTEVKT